MVTGEAPAAATIVLGLQQQAAAAMPRASATRLRRSAAVTASSTARHAQQQAAPSLLKDCSADAAGTSQTSWGSKRPWSSARTSVHTTASRVAACCSCSATMASNLTSLCRDCSRGPLRAPWPGRSRHAPGPREAKPPRSVRGPAALPPPTHATARVRRAPSPTDEESRFSAGAQRGKEKGRRWTAFTASA